MNKLYIYNFIKDPGYLNKVSSSDLFIVSTMVASKFLFDDGTGNKNTLINIL